MAWEPETSPTDRRTVRLYNVWPSFPSISISGSSCGLGCGHCSGRFLSFMKDAEDPAGLRNLLITSDGGIREEARGALISGGYDSQGRLMNLDEFLPAVQELRESGLIIKLHTGFVDQATAARIADAVDIASMEMVSEITVIRHLYHLDATPETYLDTFRNLRDAGVSHIAPHICLGLPHSSEEYVEWCLEMLAEEIQPSTISFILFTPTEGTPSEGHNPPSPNLVEHAFARAKWTFPGVKTILGAVRPRGAAFESEPSKGGASDRRHEVEMAAIKGGADGIEVPARSTIGRLTARGHHLVRVDSFGVLPIELEGKVNVEEVH